MKSLHRNGKSDKFPVADKAVYPPSIIVALTFWQGYELRRLENCEGRKQDSKLPFFADPPENFTKDFPFVFVAQNNRLVFSILRLKHFGMVIVLQARHHQFRIFMPRNYDFTL